MKYPNNDPILGLYLIIQNYMPRTFWRGYFRTWVIVSLAWGAYYFWQEWPADAWVHARWEWSGRNPWWDPYFHYRDEVLAFFGRLIVIPPLLYLAGAVCALAVQWMI